MSEDKDRKWETEDDGDDVEAHQKSHLGNAASDEPKEDDGDDDVEAHAKWGKL